MRDLMRNATPCDRDGLKLPQVDQPNKQLEGPGDLLKGLGKLLAKEVPPGTV